MTAAIQDEAHREANVLTFLATASGMSFLGLASAFWGLVIGSIAYFVLHRPWRAASTSANAFATKA